MTGVVGGYDRSYDTVVVGKAQAAPRYHRVFYQHDSRKIADVIHIR